MSEQMRFELAGGPYAVTAARLALADIDQMLDESQAFDVRLLVSELVTNAVQHAETGPDDSIDLELSIGDEVIRVDVFDAGPGFTPPTDAGTQRDRGWGLFFVAQLADRWGVEEHDSKSRVWFEIDRAGREAADQNAA